MRGTLLGTWPVISCNLDISPAKWVSCLHLPDTSLNFGITYPKLWGYKVEELRWKPGLPDESTPFSTAQCSCAHWVLVEIVSPCSTCSDFPIKVVAGHEQLKVNPICYKSRVWNKWAVSAWKCPHPVAPARKEGQQTSLVLTNSFYSLKPC